MSAIAFLLSIYLLCIQSLKSPLVYLDISSTDTARTRTKIKIHQNLATVPACSAHST